MSLSVSGLSQPQVLATISSSARLEAVLPSASHAFVCSVCDVYHTHANSAALIKELKAAGFELISTRGSHHKLRNADNVTVIVPHPRKDLGNGLVAAIRKQAGLD